MGIISDKQVYELYEQVHSDKEDEVSRLNYFFISEGDRFVIKVIEYTYMMQTHGKRI